ncbi:MAG: MotA/TolQ/ExbB proton channel family protein [Alphaproteobacteria bacterium GM7ARS4]|nr:MotA/TolQ/ExbB proton channel family protein [Alphaproteobacteria bacterium GM7ARS4]
MNVNAVTMPSRDSSSHQLFITWCLLVSLYTFILYIVWDVGVLTRLYLIDKSFLSIIISILFFATTLHCGIHSFHTAQQLHQARTIETYLAHHPHQAILYQQGTLAWHAQDGQAPPLHTHKTLHNYLRDTILQRKQDYHDSISSHDMTERYLQPLYDHAEHGWFMADVMIKLGLLGTVVGFIIMLSTITRIDSLDIDTVRMLLVTMGTGMATALYTTLVGLICALLVIFQYRPLDKGGQSLAHHMCRIALLNPSSTPSQPTPSQPKNR